MLVARTANFVFLTIKGKLECPFRIIWIIVRNFTHHSRWCHQNSAFVSLTTRHCLESKCQSTFNSSRKKIFYLCGESRDARVPGKSFFIFIPFHLCRIKKYFLSCLSVCNVQSPYPFFGCFWTLVYQIIFRDCRHGIQAEASQIKLWLLHLGYTCTS